MKDLCRDKGLTIEDAILYVLASGLVLFVLGMLGLICLSAYQSVMGTSCT